MIFKVDFEKVFDSVNWKFLQNITRQMGFGQKWRKWIGACGAEHFDRSTGPDRQTGPTGPDRMYFGPGFWTNSVFGLPSGLTKNPKIMACRTGPDRPGPDRTISVRSSINLSKSRLFGVGVPEADVEMVASSLGCTHDFVPFMYLGLPVDCNLGVYHSWIPRKVNICVWRASINRLPTRANLISRGVPLASVLCPFCENEEEGIEHCLIRCPRVMPIWRKVWSWWQLPTPVTFPSFSIMDIALGKLVTHDSPRLKEEDIFPSIQRLKKTWISARYSSRPISWNCWISSPYDLFVHL
nr:hypothetical protein [Tanacetum cinerariifolium]